VLLGHLPGFELSHDFFPQQGDLFWTPADWAWAGGLLDSLLPTWHYGYPILAFKFARKFDPERALWLMAEFNVRNAFLPPAALKMMKQVLPSQQSRTIRLRTVMSGGEALGPEVFQWALAKLGVSINEIFGQTEANYVVGNCREIMPIKPASMGRPYPGHSVRLLNERGSPVGKGELGEIAVRSDSPVVFLRYWNNGVATGNKFRDGWLLTGDLAVEDDDGYLFFNGRVDDIIGSSGYRIGPTEIEECLLRHPSVALAAVIGVPDEARGMVVKAFIQLANGYSPSDGLATEIQAYVKNQFAAYAYPRLIEFIDEIPTTTTGKIRRDELRRREGCSSGS
jgi:acetyl-CoA synthetase